MRKDLEASSRQDHIKQGCMKLFEQQKKLRFDRAYEKMDSETINLLGYYKQTVNKDKFAKIESIFTIIKKVRAESLTFFLYIYAYGNNFSLHFYSRIPRYCV